jgi:hypothetical protein
MMPIEENLDGNNHFPVNFTESLSLLEKFKIRLIWLAGRLAYEAAYYAEAKNKRLNPIRALYGPNHPVALSTVSGLSINHTHFVITGNFIYSPLK